MPGAIGNVLCIGVVSKARDLLVDVGVDAQREVALAKDMPLEVRFR